MGFGGFSYSGRRSLGTRVPGGVGEEAFTPAADASLAHLYEGDDLIVISDEIERYADKEGANDAIAPAEANRPDYSASIAALNGKPGGVYTQASMHWVDTGAITSIPQPWTAIVAFSPTTNTDQAIFGSTSPRWFLDISSGNFRFFAGTSTVSLGAATGGSAYTMILVANGTSSKARINGVSVYAGATNLGASACERIILGREGTANHTHGSIALAAVRSGDLTADADLLASWETYLEGFRP